MKMFFFSLCGNLCYMFYRRRTVFWRGRVHQFMILSFFIKTSCFWYFLEAFVTCFQICCPKRIIYSYIFWIYWTLDIFYVLKSEHHKKKKRFTQYMPFAIPGKNSAGCWVNCILETAQRNCKKSLSLYFTVKIFHEAPSFERPWQRN